jgi:hypothetical protein
MRQIRGQTISLVNMRIRELLIAVAPVAERPSCVNPAHGLPA